jgi:hypothetical protein
MDSTEFFIASVREDLSWLWRVRRTAAGFECTSWTLSPADLAKLQSEIVVLGALSEQRPASAHFDSAEAAFRFFAQDRDDLATRAAQLLGRVGVERSALPIARD